MNALQERIAGMETGQLVDMLSELRRMNGPIKGGSWDDASSEVRAELLCELETRDGWNEQLVDELDARLFWSAEQLAAVRAMHASA